MWGELNASYDDEDTDKWVKAIFKWIKENGKKVYRTSTTRNITADEAEKKTYALKEASINYSGQNGQYLTIGKDIYCVAKDLE